MALHSPFSAVICTTKDPCTDAKQPSLHNHLDRLNLDRDEITVSSSSVPKPKRFRRLATFTADQLKSADEATLRSLFDASDDAGLITGKHVERENRTLSTAHPYPAELEGATASIFNATAALEERNEPMQSFQDCSFPTAASTSMNGISHNGYSHASKVRRTIKYQQVLRRDGLNHFESFEAATDPLSSFAVVHDVVCIDASEESHSQDPHHVQKACKGKNDAIAMDRLMSIVHEYLNEESRVQDRCSSSRASDLARGKAVVERGGSGKESTDSYVYDLYVEASAPQTAKNKQSATCRDLQEEEEEVADDGTEDEDDWLIEMHDRGVMPFVSIVEDDIWLVHEASDMEDSQYDSEDSNAEGYFGNDYPDEESGFGDGSEDGEYDSDEF